MKFQFAARVPSRVWGSPASTLLNKKNPELHRRSGFAVLGFLLVLFTPLGKLLVGALDVVAALHMVAGALRIVDAGGGVVVALGHTALLDHRVRQRDGRQQAPGVGMDGMLEDLLGGAGLQ